MVEYEQARIARYIFSGRKKRTGIRLLSGTGLQSEFLERNVIRRSSSTRFSVGASRKICFPVLRKRFRNTRETGIQTVHGTNFVILTPKSPNGHLRLGRPREAASRTPHSRTRSSDSVLCSLSSIPSSELRKIYESPRTEPVCGTASNSFEFIV